MNRQTRGILEGLAQQLEEALEDWRRGRSTDWAGSVESVAAELALIASRGHAETDGTTGQES